MASGLVLSGGGSELYRNMEHAIAKCDAIDDLKDIADKSVALSAYYKQIKDDDSVRRFKRVRIRAYRQIGRLLVGSIKLPKTATSAERVAAIRKAMPNDQTIKDLTDSRIVQILKLANVADANFERAIEVCDSVETMIDIGSDPDAIERLKNYRSSDRLANRREATPEEMAAFHEAIARDREARAAAREAERRAELKRIAAEAVPEGLIEAYNTALGEVGFTMDRRDREEMHKIVFLLKRQIYETLRQAAFDERITMQEVLRRGLIMWLTACGYPTPTESMPDKRRKSA